jgi:DNA-binding Lrp family transcriptional regulator
MPNSTLVIDDTDRRLIDQLRENARASTAALARRLGLSRTTIQSRIARLEKQKIITGYSVRMAESYELGQIHAQVSITVKPKQAAIVEAELKKISAVRALHSVSGEHDMIATVVTPTVGDMDALIDRIGSLAGVERTTSSIILSTKFER